MEVDRDDGVDSGEGNRGTERTIAGKADEFEYFYTHMDKEVSKLTYVTTVPEWAHALIITYFYHRPANETQAMYKSLGFTCPQYWYHELDLILNRSRWTNNEEFRSLTGMADFLRERGLYFREVISARDLSYIDQEDLLHAFCSQLGMHWSIFPFRGRDICR